MDPVEPGADIAPRVAPVACRVAMFQPRVKTLQELLRKTTKISKAQVGYHVSSVCLNLFFVIVITGWLHPVLFEQGCTKRIRKTLIYLCQTLFLSILYVTSHVSHILPSYMDLADLLQPSELTL